jgi:hypothetical protein
MRAHTEEIPESVEETHLEDDNLEDSFTSLLISAENNDSSQTSRGSSKETGTLVQYARQMLSSTLAFKAAFLLILSSPRIYIYLFNLPHRNIYSPEDVRKGGTLDTVTETLRWSTLLSMTYLFYILAGTIVYWLAWFYQYMTLQYLSWCERIELHVLVRTI